MRKTGRSCPVCPFCLMAGRNRQGANAGLCAPRDSLTKPRIRRPACTAGGVRPAPRMSTLTFHPRPTGGYVADVTFTPVLTAFGTQPFPVTVARTDHCARRVGPITTFAVAMPSREALA